MVEQCGFLLGTCERNPQVVIVKGLRQRTTGQRVLVATARYPPRRESCLLPPDVSRQFIPGEKLKSTNAIASNATEQTECVLPYAITALNPAAYCLVVRQKVVEKMIDDLPSMGPIPRDEGQRQGQRAARRG